MKVYVFIYNVVAIKAKLSEVLDKKDSRFILIASDYCINNLSPENQQFFHEIHRIERNFHTPDITQIEPVINDLVAQYTAKALVLLTNEDSTQLSCALLRDKYNIGGNKIHDLIPYVKKNISKLKLEGIVKTPRFELFNKEKYDKNAEVYKTELIAEIGFPMFIKPIDLVSSIGTHLVNDEKTLSIILATIRQSAWDFEIDEYIDGELFHCDFIVVHQDIKFFSACRYANPLAQFSKGKPMGSIPINDTALFDALCTFSFSALKALGIFSSAFHVEVFKDNKTGELIFLEAAARTPGALVPEMYEISHGVHIEKLHFLTQIAPEKVPDRQAPFLYAGWITYPKTDGIIKNICFPTLRIHHKTITYLEKGAQSSQASSLLDSVCSVLFWDTSHQKLTKIFERLRHSNPVILNT